MSFDVPPSEWGFVPFSATSEDYPSLPAEEGQPQSATKAGRRAQRTAMKRQQQLQELVEATIWPLKAAAGVEAKEQSAAAAKEANLEKTVVPGAAEPAALREQLPAAGKRKNRNKFKPDSAADVAVSKSDAAASDPVVSSTVVAATSVWDAEQQEPAGSRRKSKNRFKRSDAEATAATPAATSITTPVAPPQTPATVTANQQLPASTSKKRTAQQGVEADAITDIKKAAGVHPGGALGNSTTDAPLSRKKQKQLLRQQLYHAQRAAQGGKPVTDADARTPSGSNSIASHTSVVSAGKVSQSQPPAQANSSAAAASAGTAGLPPAASPVAASPPDGPPVSRKQQKRLERARLHKLQQQAGQAASSAAAVQADQTRDSVAVDTDAELKPAKTQLNGKRADPKRQQQVLKVSKAGADDARVRLPPQQRQVVVAATDDAVKGSSSLLNKMRAKLQGGRFRWLNEQLYSTTGDSAYQLMQGQPDLYSQYHEGFRQQAADWPQQPVRLALAWLKAKPAGLVVADFGCGDAQIAADACQKVHSFDLVATVPGVTACNMAHTPLADGSVDAAVFCLALMGTDYGAFLQEAHRVLKLKGWLWICEVRSRFAGQADFTAADDQSPGGMRSGGSSSGGDGGEGQSSWVMVGFVKALQRLGFKLAQRRVVNKMFVVLELQKVRPDPGTDVSWPDLKGCVYRKR